MSSFRPKKTKKLRNKSITKFTNVNDMKNNKNTELPASDILENRLKTYVRYF
jgi:hypothetical protein